MKKGCLIAFEGIDGSGKTTLAGLLADCLREKGCRVLVTRDPGSTGLGESLRNVLLFSSGPICPAAETLMYAAARAQLVAERILPALQEGLVVISDRFSDSTIAYQGYGKGVDMEFLGRVNSYSCHGLKPAITILMDIDPVLARSRIKGPADRMESEGVDFLRKVRDGYLAMADSEPGRYLVVDSSRPAEELLERVLSAAAGLL